MTEWKCVTVFLKLRGVGTVKKIRTPTAPGNCCNSSANQRIVYWWMFSSEYLLLSQSQECQAKEIVLMAAATGQQQGQWFCVACGECWWGQISWRARQHWRLPWSDEGKANFWWKIEEDHSARYNLTRHLVKEVLGNRQELAIWTTPDAQEGGYAWGL